MQIYHICVRTPASTDPRRAARLLNQKIIAPPEAIVNILQSKEAGYPVWPGPVDSVQHITVPLTCQGGAESAPHLSLVRPYLGASLLEGGDRT